MLFLVVCWFFLFFLGFASFCSQTLCFTMIFLVVCFVFFVFHWFCKLLLPNALFYNAFFGCSFVFFVFHWFCKLLLPSFLFYNASFGFVHHNNQALCFTMLLLVSCIITTKPFVLQCFFWFRA